MERLVFMLLAIGVPKPIELAFLKLNETPHGGPSGVGAALRVMRT